MVEAIHHSYISPGLVDGQAMVTQAEKNQLKGYTTWVHYHGYGKPCDDKCKLFEPAKKEN